MRKFLIFSALRTSELNYLRSIKTLVMTKYIITTMLVATSIYLNAQDANVIELTNPSFEDFPRISKPPRGWYDCGFSNESPPDVHPVVDGGEFRVMNEAQDKETYLGLVVRDNDTWESVAQRLKTPLKANKCYSFSVYIARSITYQSLSRVTGESANYATPARLRIWGGNSYCDKVQLLGETKEVINTRWLKREFKFEPKVDVHYITLEAFYKTPILFPYNGNILLDNASSIQLIPCNEELEEPVNPVVQEEVVNVQPPVVIEPKVTPSANNTSTPQPEQTVNKPSSKTTPATSPSSNTNNRITIAGKTKQELKKGEVIKIDNLVFEVDKAEISSSSFLALNQLYDFLNEHKDVIIEIGGHTNGMCDDEFCNELSTARAKAVATYLYNKGIDMERLQYKGYGKRYPIATNSTPTGRRTNQRVEIKILNFG